MANSIRFAVGVDDKASKPIRDIRDAWRRLQSDGAQGLTAGVSAAVAVKAFDLLGTAVHSATDFLADSVKASIDEAAGVERLTTSLKANVPAWNGQTDAIEATIKQREALAFSDDDLRDSLSRLVGATHDVGQAFDLQSLAMDLARFKGIDLASATEQIVKVNAGQYRSLKELGIQIDSTATSEQALAQVHKITAGQAQAFGSTTAGAMQAAGIAVHDLQEEIGGKLAPAVRDAADWTRKDLIPALERAIDVIGGVVSGANDLANAVAHLPDNKRVPILADAIDLVTGAFNAARAPANQWYDAVTKDAQAAKDAAAAANSQADATSAAGSAAAGATPAINDQAAKTIAAALAAGEQADAQARLNDVLGLAADHYGSVADSSSAASQYVDASTAAASGAATAMNTASRAADDLARALNDIPRNIDINFQFRGPNGLGGAVNSGLPQGSADTNAGTAVGTEGDQGALDQRNAAAQAQQQLNDARQRAIDEANRKAQQAADQAARAATQAAEEQARVVRQKLGDAYDDMRDRVKRAMDDVHAAKLRDIDDTLAQKNAVIDAQEAQIKGKVTAAQSEVDKLRNDRRRRGLEAAVSSAATPEEKARAVQDLNDFLDEQRIARLQADADSKVSALETEKAKNEALAKADKDREDARYKAQQDAYAADLKALDRYLRDYVGRYDTAYARIAALGTKYGVAAANPKAKTTETKAASVSAVPVTTGLGPTPVATDTGVPEIHVYLDSTEIAARVVVLQARQRNLRTPQRVSTGFTR